MNIRLRDILLGLRGLGLEKSPVVVHASLSAFGQVEGDAETVVSAIAAVFQTILMPAFTYKTMVTPRAGPPDNGLVYGSGTDLNRMAEFFHPRMPVDRLMGIIPETLRRHPRAERSGHPILSFTGLNAGTMLEAQTIDEPFGPLKMLEQANGWVVLMGVNHTVNTSIHTAEKLAGRKTFVRWALTRKKVVECPSFPGCSAGFEAIAAEMERYTRKAKIGEALVQAVPMKMLFRVVTARLKQNPLALLCQAEDCERCREIRNAVKREKDNDRQNQQSDPEYKRPD
jgi:aminoglycoside 3-N-acetyltransferase